MCEHTAHKCVYMKHHVWTVDGNNKTSEWLKYVGGLFLFVFNYEYVATYVPM